MLEFLFMSACAMSNPNYEARLEREISRPYHAPTRLSLLLHFKIK